MPAIPAAVDDVALRCLAKNPRQRLQPHEISRALSNALLQLDTTPLYDAGSSTTATARSSGEVSLPALDAIQDVARWQRRVGTAVAGVALTVLWFTIAGLVASVSYNQPLGRAGAFSDESPLLWPIWGMRAMSPRLAGALFSPWVCWRRTSVLACVVGGDTSVSTDVPGRR